MTHCRTAVMLHAMKRITVNFDERTGKALSDLAWRNRRSASKEIQCAVSAHLAVMAALKKGGRK